MTGFTISGLPSGMKYFWKVGYVDSGNNVTTYSTESSFVVENLSQDTTKQVYAGTSVNDYTIVSFTKWPEEQSATIVFGLEPDNTLFE